MNKVLAGHSFEDMFARHAQWRASDHAVVHDLYVVDVLPSAAVTEPHAWFNVVETGPATQAFPATQDGTCHMRPIGAPPAVSSFRSANLAQGLVAYGRFPRATLSAVVNP